MEEKALKELEELSGEQEVKNRPRYNVPIVRFQGRDGKFLKKIFDEEGNRQEIDLGKSIQGVMLKVRRMFLAWGKDYRLFTNEHNSWKDKILLFEGKKTEKGIITQVIDMGLISDLRKKYPELKMRQLIYFLLQPTNEIVKLQIKGKGLSNLFDYWATFKPNEHIFQYVTQIKAQEERSNLGSYMAPVFGRLKEVDDLDLIANKIKEVASKIAEIESYYVEQPVPEEIISEEPDIPEKEETEEIKTIDPEGFPIYGPKENLKKKKK